MKYYIEYEIPTAGGHYRKNAATAYTKKEVDEICEAIEKLGYKITMVNHHDSEYGVL